jgi:hypothetical protein
MVTFEITNEDEALLMRYHANENRIKLEKELLDFIQKIYLDLFKTKVDLRFADHSGLLFVAFNENLERVCSLEPDGGFSIEAGKNLEDKFKDDYALAYGFTENQFKEGYIVVSRKLHIGEMLEAILHAPIHLLYFQNKLVRQYCTDPKYPHAWEIEEVAVQTASDYLLLAFENSLGNDSKLRGAIVEYRETYKRMAQMENDFYNKLLGTSPRMQRNRIAHNFYDTITSEFSAYYMSFLSQVKRGETKRIIAYMLHRGGYTENRIEKKIKDIFEKCNYDFIKYSNLLGNCLTFEDVERLQIP